MNSDRHPTIESHSQASEDAQRGAGAPDRALDLDIPLGSLEAAAFAELPYTFRPSGHGDGFYQELFG